MAAKKNPVEIVKDVVEGIELSVRELKEVKAIIDDILTKTTIGKDIKVSVVDILLNLCDEVEEHLSATDKKIEIYNQSAQKVEDQYRTPEGLPVNGTNPEYDEHYTLLKTEIEKIMNTKYRVLHSELIPIADFPTTTVLAISRKVLRRWFKKGE